MRPEFRIGLWIGLSAAFAVALYCAWLWQAERQVARHTENLFRKMEQKNWNSVGDLIAADYGDQWNHDRALLLERMRLMLGYARHFRINTDDPNCKIDKEVGIWHGKISIDSDDAELAAMVKERVNSLTTTPFELQWRRVSGKPWDWKLVRVSNPELEIPTGFD